MSVIMTFSKNQSIHKISNTKKNVQKNHEKTSMIKKCENKATVNPAGKLQDYDLHHGDASLMWFSVNVGNGERV